MSPTEFQQQVLPLKNQLFRFAWSYLGNEADAKDVVQDVMLKVWEQQKRVEIRNLEAWCMKLTRNHALDKLKRKGRNYLPIAEQYDLHSEEADPLKQTEELEFVGRLRQAMEQLPEAQREAIQLRDVEGYSYQEIAELLQLELNHVKVLLHRARKKVKEQLIRVHNHGII